MIKVRVKIKLPPSVERFLAALELDLSAAFAQPQPFDAVAPT
jgi:hypothetical protein